MKRSLLVAVAFLAALSLSGLAQARELGAIYTDCGLGGMLGPAISKDSGAVLAVITNVTWDLGTTASSSDISSPDTCKGGSGMAARFIHDSYDYIAANLAEGGGHHIDSLLQVTGCDAAIWDSATIELRKDLANLAGDASYSQSTSFDKADRFFQSYVNTLEQKYPGKCSLS